MKLLLLFLTFFIFQFSHALETHLLRPLARDLSFEPELKDKDLAQKIRLLTAQSKIRELKRLIEKGLDLGIRNKEKETLLHWAVEHKNLNLVKFLVEKKIDIDAKKEGGETALLLSLNHEIFHSNHRPLAHYLISQGANIHHKSKEEGLSALHLASEQGLYRILEDLLKKGAEVNVKTNYLPEPINSSGNTPLHLAAASHIRSMKILIQYGADVNAKNDRGHTPLHVAAREGLAQATHFLLRRGAQINLKDKDRFTPLHQAILSGNVKTVEVLLKHKAHAHTISKEGWSPLHLVTSSPEKQSQLANLLIKHKANINFKGELGWSILHLASMQGLTDLVKTLLSYKIDLNAVIGKSHLPFLQDSHASFFSNVTDIMVLTTYDLKGGLPTLGATAAHLAVFNDRKDILKLLAKKGANLNLKDAHKRAPIYYALINKDIPMVKLLYKLGAKLPSRPVMNKIDLRIRKAVKRALNLQTPQGRIKKAGGRR